MTRGQSSQAKTQGTSATERTIERPISPTLSNPYRGGRKKRGQFQGAHSSPIAPVNPVPTYPPGAVRVEQGTQSTNVCNTYGRGHSGPCRLGKNVCYRYGQLGHFSRDCPQRNVHQSVPLVSQTIVQMERPRGRGSADRGRAQTQTFSQSVGLS